MRKYLIPTLGVVVEATGLSAAMRQANELTDGKSDFVIGCNDDGNTCIYNGDAVGHSKGFCTADACY